MQFSRFKDEYLSTCARFLSMHKKHMTVVIVGANDGMTNDPIYEFLQAYSKLLNIIAVEPNDQLITFLQDNYKKFSNFSICNSAIGPQGVVNLYRIKEEVWNQFRPSYAHEWPYYRAATGVTSQDRRHVENALVEQNLNPINAIEKVTVTSTTLANLLREIKCSKVEVLQVDVEGFDDQVIYYSDIAILKPKVIYYEDKNLPQERRKALCQHLTNLHYKIYQDGANSMALHKTYPALAHQAIKLLIGARMIKQRTVAYWNKQVILLKSKNHLNPYLND